MAMEKSEKINTLEEVLKNTNDFFSTVNDARATWGEMVSMYSQKLKNIYEEEELGMIWTEENPLNSLDYALKELSNSVDLVRQDLEMALAGIKEDWTI